MGKDGKGEKRKKSKDEKKKHKRARHEEKKHKRSREEKKRSKNSSAGGKERVTESISSEDFFRLSEEFRVWLKMAKNRCGAANRGCVFQSPPHSDEFL